MSTPDATLIGKQLHQHATELFPICRSITGGGVRQTLRLIQKHIPLAIHEVPSGSTIFDWEVPMEWNIEEAYISDPQGRRVVDFQNHNLHIVSYSEPVSTRLPLIELKKRLHVHAKRSDWIPYRTSYYRRDWGFCLSRDTFNSLVDGQYKTHIASSLQPGSLTYGECVIPGSHRDEVLLFTHICHPSLANDNTSGMAIATKLASWLLSAPRRYSYRLVFAPGTIGSLCWLKQNERRLARIKYGLVLGLLGDTGPLSYKYSRRGDSEIDVIAKVVLAEMEPAARLLPFEPYGYDERQLCSPGFNLPVGRLTRSYNDAYPEYHSSADNLDFINPDSLQQSLEACQRIVTIIEDNRRYLNLKPKGEPRLGKRGLYGAVGGQSPAAREHAMLWLLNQSDGHHSVLDIAQRSKLSFTVLRDAGQELQAAGLMRDCEKRTGTQSKAKRVPVKRKK
jgi:aminopeptidase-like protein